MFETSPYGTSVLTRYNATLVSTKGKARPDVFIERRNDQSAINLPTGNYHFTIRSVDGRVVKRRTPLQGGAPYALSNQGLRTGLYLIQVESPAGPQVLKWVVE